MRIANQFTRSICPIHECRQVSHERQIFAVASSILKSRLACLWQSIPPLRLHAHIRTLSKHSLFTVGLTLKRMKASYILVAGTNSHDFEREVCFHETSILYRWGENFLSTLREIDESGERSSRPSHTCPTSDIVIILSRFRPCRRSGDRAGRVAMFDTTTTTTATAVLRRT